MHRNRVGEALMCLTWLSGACAIEGRFGRLRGKGGEKSKKKIRNTGILKVWCECEREKDGPSLLISSGQRIRQITFFFIFLRRYLQPRPGDLLVCIFLLERRLWENCRTKPESRETRTVLPFSNKWGAHINSKKSWALKSQLMRGEFVHMHITKRGDQQRLRDSPRPIRSFGSTNSYTWITLFQLM
jgi:hypothetical protein